jgi:glycosyltransferase involved in cell wall biosynthesis
MSKILLLGYLPPQLYAPIKIEAANYRTAQFLIPLLEDRHQVCLCTAPPLNNEPVTIKPAWENLLDYQPIPFEQVGWVNQLQKVHDTFQPDCIVAVNFDMCVYATKLKTDRPIWMDIYGDMITIMQASCYRARSNRGLPTTLKFVEQVLRKGDKFSVCGVPQRNMTVGELAMSGRLNWQSFGYEFTEVIPAGMEGQEAVQVGQDGSPVRANAGIGIDDFVVMWCGGYNTWTDVITLHKGLESAMAENPMVHFVSVGASTYQSADNTYAKFQELIEKSRYRDRFHLFGWQPWSKLGEFYRASNSGINIDAIHYETIYGTRTRLMEMILYHLPVVTSLGTELSYLLQNRQAALTFDVGDWSKLTENILKLASDPNYCAAMSATAYEYAVNELSFSATTKNFRQWCGQPQHAPDYHTYHTKSLWIIELIHQLRSDVRFALWSFLGVSK